MKHRALIAAIAATLALAGCAKEEEKAAASRPAPQPPATPAQVAAPSTGSPTPDYVCRKNGKCEVGITVKDCSPGGIVLDYAAIGVERGNTDVDITWSIATADYEFAPADGVKFKGGEWQQEFKDGKANKNQYTWHDLNPRGASQSRAFPYSVTIVKKGGAACATKDPTVINDV